MTDNQKKPTQKELPIDVVPGTTPEFLLHKLHSFESRLAEFITNFSGSMPFVYFHIVWFVAWMLANQGLLPNFHPFDPYPYGLLTMIVSLEAIFLSTFIMISQNRQALLETYRELEEEQEAEEQEDEVEDIQKDLDDIKNAINFIQQKVASVEKVQGVNGGPPHKV